MSITIPPAASILKAPAQPLPPATRTTSAAFLFVDQPAAAEESDAQNRAAGMDQDVLEALRSSITESGGRELDLTVDSLPAVFPTVGAALACATAIRAHTTALQVAGRSVAVRIGIHAGEPLAIEDGRFFGSAVWTTARLCGRARAGQTLVSATARHLLSPDLDAQLTPAGTVQLKGIADPVEVFSLHGEVAARPAGLELVSVLAVDQVGSTAIIDAHGDSGARVIHAALIDVIREAAEDHGGTELEYGGDGLTIAFPSAFDGASAAIAMQQAAHQHRHRFGDDGELHLRVAIVTGEADRRQRRSLGALAVQANTLGKLATDDRILLGSTAHELAAERRTFTFKTTGEGAAELEWQPDSSQPVLPSGLQPADRFIGRVTELDRIRSRWEQTQHGQQVVLLDGDAGIGKSALLAEFIAQVSGGPSGAGATAFYGRCPEASSDDYEAFTDAFSGFVGSSTRAELRRMLGPHVEILARVLPSLLTRLPGTTVGAIDARAEPFAIARALQGLLDGICASGPAILVLDDLQYASSALLTALRALITGLAPRRLLIVAIYRSPDFAKSPVPAALGASSTDVEEWSLRGLTTADVGALITSVAEEIPDPDLVQSIAAESEGIPYFVLELARARLRRGAERSVQQSAHQVESWRLDIRQVQDRVADEVLQVQRLRSGPALEQSRQLPLDPDGTPPISGPNPYRGLASFDRDDADWFFGRELLTAELIAHLAGGRALAVVGASGSGKSSVVRAGLLPALADGALPTSADWLPVVITPGGAPLDATAAALASTLGEDRASVRQQLDQEHLAALVQRITDNDDTRRLVLVIDQAEELFTETSESDRDAFVDELVAALDTSTSFSLIMVVRADFYGAWANYPTLKTRLEHDHVLVGAMTDDEVRQAIEAPARHAGLVVEAALTDAIVADISGEPGALPLLSTALVETWLRRRGRSLTLGAYAETGGVRRAIARLADDAISSLAEADRVIARRILERLARPAEHDREVDVRRRAPISELVALNPRASAVLAVLVQRRLVLADESAAEVTHEALLREWPLLRGWLAEDRRGRLLHQQVADDAAAWDAAGRDVELLYRGSRLAIAADLATQAPESLTRTERDFLHAARERTAADLLRARRTAARLRRLTVGLVIGLVVALIAGGAAVVQGRAATRAATTADASALSSRAALLLDSQQDVAGLLAASAMKLDPSASARDALVEVANRTPDLTGTTPLASGTATLQAISGDGETAAVLDGHNVLHLLALPSKREIRRVNGGSASLSAVSLSPDGRYAALVGPRSGVSDDTRAAVRIIDTRSGRTLTTRAAVATVTFPAPHLAALVDATTLRASYLELPSGHPMTLPGPTRAGPVEASRDGSVLAWGDSNKQSLLNGTRSFAGSNVAHLVDLRTGRSLPRTYPGGLLAISDDGSLIALQHDGKLQVIRISDGHTIASTDTSLLLSDAQVSGSPGAVAAFSRDGSEVAFIGADAGAPLYRMQVATGDLTATTVPIDHRPNPPIPAADGSFLVTGYHAAARYQRTDQTEAPAGPTRSPRYEGSNVAAFVGTDPTGQHVVEVTDQLQANSADTYRYRIFSNSLHHRPVVITPPTGTNFDSKTAAFDRTGTLLATLEFIGGTNTAVASVWDDRTGRELARVGPFRAFQGGYFSVPVSAVAFIGATSRLGVITSPGDPEFADQTTSLLLNARLQTWDWRTNTRTLDVALPAVSAVALSLDGQQAATAGRDGFRLLSTTTGRIEGTAPAPGAVSPDPTVLQFSLDGSRVWMGSEGLAEQWSTRHPSTPHQVRFTSPRQYSAWTVSLDGTTLASISTRGVELRRLDDGRIFHELQGVDAQELLGFSRDTRTLVTWDGKNLHTLDTTNGNVQALGTAYERTNGAIVVDDPAAAFTDSTITTLVSTQSSERTDRFAVSTAAATKRVCAVAGRRPTAEEWSQIAPRTPLQTVC